MKKTFSLKMGLNPISRIGGQIMTAFLLFFLPTKSIYAQSSATQIRKLPEFTFKNGIGIIAPDSQFSLNMRFRFQSRFMMFSQSTSDLSPNSWEARVRRARLSFTGHLYNPKLTYYLQLSFSRGDMDWSMADASTINTSPNVVRDAVIYYKPTKTLQLGFGQTKLPGNRQRVISSGAQQFYDRSVVNAALTLDRDFGAFANYSVQTGKVKTIFKGAITTGEGRNSVTSNSGLAYTGRLEILPLGEFTDGGDYFEGDLIHEAKPKLSIAAGYQLNDLAMRTQGQLGKDLYAPKTYQEFVADALLKYKGWAASYEYLDRTSDVGPISTNSTGSKRALLLGKGYNAQLSYCTKSQWEIAGRYTFLQPNNLVYSYYNSIEQYGGGVTKYLVKHKVKAQFNIFYNKEKNLSTLKTGIENIFGVLQFEVGI
jgi:phosphate-selective porin OprO/OprP